MPIIIVSEKTRWKRKAKIKDRQEQRETIVKVNASYSESVGAKSFCCAFKN